MTHTSIKFLAASAIVLTTVGASSVLTSPEAFASSVTHTARDAKRGEFEITTNPFKDYNSAESFSKTTLKKLLEGTDYSSTVLPSEPTNPKSGYEIITNLYYNNDTFSKTAAQTLANNLVSAADSAIAGNQPAGDTTEKPDKKPAGDTTENSAGDKVEKPNENPTGDTTEKPDKKPAGDKVENPAGDTTVKPDEKPAGDKVEKPDEKSLDKVKAAAIAKLKEAGITGEIYFKQINAAKTVEGVNSLTDEILKAHKPAVKPDQKPDQKPTGDTTVKPDVKPTGDTTVKPDVKPTGDKVDKPTGAAQAQKLTNKETLPQTAATSGSIANTLAGVFAVVVAAFVGLKRKLFN